ncbi:MAG: hypothetical protein A3E19_01225 [Planctomycetes bacterium RIFCSPHIGHO2_12_FULL_52_36]|nr:MAG: hypothetical protein A3D89_04185 [Planctomycetes bacterium RIFCSPHIGHO2_02_FULL_52_58]OHB93209.1 MAG: hypothetical protein A3E19_01225 [Planctomycetes bacterium RIFCSPHIGHO2_12_FULL_52_36]
MGQGYAKYNSKVYACQSYIFFSVKYIERLLPNPKRVPTPSNLVRMKKPCRGRVYPCPTLCTPRKEFDKMAKKP